METRLVCVCGAESKLLCVIASARAVSIALGTSNWNACCLPSRPFYFVFDFVILKSIGKTGWMTFGYAASVGGGEPRIALHIGTTTI